MRAERRAGGGRALEELRKLTERDSRGASRKVEAVSLRELLGQAYHAR
ncbi:MAG: hypothetical protein QXU72_08450 [Thermofilum sp.]